MFSDVILLYFMTVLMKYLLNLNVFEVFLKWVVKYLFSFKLWKLYILVIELERFKIIVFLLM